ncbi:hypothetical protein [Qipengyuania sp. ASV99]|uniref:hypothetical protein n=1 Tax=Qipengyuania sp. ASV99 TaxID=3399681 RepID=UPI003A4C737C
MFEQSKPLGIPQSTRFSDEDALRCIDWREVTARLNAARDLRRVLRDDARGNGNVESFSEAAARYFRTRDCNEPDVNPDALEHGKGSPCIIPPSELLPYPQEELRGRGHALTGDARDTE